jgi:Phosphotransferase enzyme family
MARTTSTGAAVVKPFRVAPSAEHVLDTARLLWPAPATARLVRTGEPAGDAGSTRELLFVPSAARPRLLLPAASAASAAAALRRYSHALGPLERVGRTVGAAAVRTGLAHRLLRDRLRILLPTSSDPVAARTGTGGADATIETVLSELLGEPVVVNLGLGNRRANQKPVLHALSPDGRSLAFVKVGDNHITRPLVQAEAAALEHLAGLGLSRIRVPRVLHRMSWRGLELLVLSPVHTTPRRRAGARRLPFAAFVELATAGGVEESSLATSAYWKLLDATAEQVVGESAERLREALDIVAARHGDDVLSFGAWHGDWTPWNMSWERSGVAVWDWERFATGVPIGFDALHYQLRLNMARSGATDGAALDLVRHAPELLHHSGVPPWAFPATTTLYLLELCLRFTVAAQGPTGRPLRPRAEWLSGFVAAHLGTRRAS